MGLKCNAVHSNVAMRELQILPYKQEVLRPLALLRPPVTFHSLRFERIATLYRYHANPQKITAETT